MASKKQDAAERESAERGPGRILLSEVLEWAEGSQQIAEALGQGIQLPAGTTWEMVRPPAPADGKVAEATLGKDARDSLVRRGGQRTPGRGEA